MICDVCTCPVEKEKLASFYISGIEKPKGKEEKYMDSCERLEKQEYRHSIMFGCPDENNDLRYHLEICQKCAMRLLQGVEQQVKMHVAHNKEVKQMLETI
jgi:hypothetical protein